jgi:hypothetical protein
MLVDLARLVDELALQYAPLALQKGLTLRKHVLPTAVVRSDPVLLKRLVGNLLSNALRNTHRGAARGVLKFGTPAWALPKSTNRRFFRSFIAFPGAAWKKALAWGWPLSLA